MGESQIPHAGIELDVICLNGLSDEQGESIPEELLSDPGNSKVFVNSILEKISAQDAFVSFAGQISNVNKILAMKYSSASDIAEVILKDMALTSTVLKLVNSSFYRHFSKKGISTISEAMIILGTEEIRLAAASLKVYEMLQSMGNSRILKEKTLKGLQRSLMARQIAVESGNREDDSLQISGMIYDLGEYLVALFDPGKYIRIEMVMEEKSMSRQEAAKSVLGLSYSDLGQVVASSLNLPAQIVQAIQPILGFDIKKEKMGKKLRQRYLCSFVNDLCDLPASGSRENIDQKIASVVDKYQDILDIDLAKAKELVQSSKGKIVKHAALLNIEPVFDPRQDKDPDRQTIADLPHKNEVKNKKALEHGLDQISQGLDLGKNIHEILTDITAILYKNFSFIRVGIAIKNKARGTMDARFFKGEDSKGFLRAFSFKLSQAPDLFNRSISTRTDIIVKDILKEKFTKQIPPWYIENLAKESSATGFGVFPVSVRNKNLAMIYLDWDEAAHPIDPETVEYIRRFRKMMVKTFTLHSR